MDLDTIGSAYACRRPSLVRYLMPRLLLRLPDLTLPRSAPKGWRMGIALACLVANSLPPAAQAAQPPKAFRTLAQSGAPIKFAAPASARPGICREVAHRMELIDPGLKFTGLATEAPLRRIELSLERGEIDVFFCLLDTPERRQRFDYLPVPIYRVQHVLAVRVDETRNPLSLRELADMSRSAPVLVTQGSVLARTLAKAGVAHLEAAPTDQSALRMLVAGRAEAVYGQDLNLQVLLKTPEFAGKIRLLETRFVDEQHYVVVSRHLPKAAVERIAAALAQIERSAWLRELQATYQQP